ncbi:MAG: DUF3592 domain-containing protein [Candidatus Sericytochromatia bacterium]
MKSRLDPAFLISLAIFALVGLCFCLGAVWTAWEKHQIISTWPRTQAQVLQSRVALFKPTVYQAEIQLSYQIQGKTYTPTLKSEETSSIHGLMQALVERYPVGSPRSLPYSPGDPQKPVLDAGYHLRFFFLPLLLAVMGFIFSLIAFLTWLWEFFPAKPKTQSTFRSGKHLLRWVAGIFAGIGLLLLGIVGGWGLKQAQARQWPEIKAEIVRSQVLAYQQRSSTRYYAPALDLIYTVGGIVFLRPVCPESGLSEAEAAEKVATAYGLKQLLSLRYNPSNPYEIELYPPSMTFAWILGGMGAVFLILGSGIGLVFGKFFKVS